MPSVAPGSPLHQARTAPRQRRRHAPKLRALLRWPVETRQMSGSRTLAAIEGEDLDIRVTSRSVREPNVARIPVEAA